MALAKVPPNARAVSFGRGHRFAAYPRCSADTCGNGENVRVSSGHVRLRTMKLGMAGARLRIRVRQQGCRQRRSLVQARGLAPMEGVGQGARRAGSGERRTYGCDPVAYCEARHAPCTLWE